ncbi:SdpI family protein [Microbacterium sp. Se5.02b]|uniref:SdpI family protein n=1 Tax=Microbacterium sp. Se5.02b TaxID=2864103 RepID=UPI001C68D3B7|nr:SdpI family protein [Microbacterium sp. Se5.02b]QYM62841.1 SdpI family protein [Microbacterium sp. Se5.02b]
MMEIAGAGVMVLFGAALLWWARASRRGTFPRQRILGYRTSRTLRDGDAWVSAHRAMAPLLFVAGGGVVLAALAAATAVLVGHADVGRVLLGGAVVWGLVLVIGSALPAASAARSTRDTSGS